MGLGADILSAVQSLSASEKLNSADIWDAIGKVIEDYHDGDIFNNRCIGSSSFVGSSSYVSISHDFGEEPSVVAITPTEDPEGYLGEVWVLKYDTEIRVYNSGSATTAFDYIMYR